MKRISGKFLKLVSRLAVLVSIAVVVTFSAPSLFTGKFVENKPNEDNRTNSAYIMHRSVQKGTNDGPPITFANEVSKIEAKPLYFFNRSMGIDASMFRVNVSTNIPLDNFRLHPLSSEQPYRNRMLGIRDRCKRNPDRFFNEIDTARFVNDGKHATIMCVVPKNACTTWKAILMYFKGKIQAVQEAYKILPQLELDRGKIKSMKRLPLSLAAKCFNEHMKFMISRHPFERLVSAYNSKFGKKSASYMKSHGRYIARNGIKHFLGTNYVMPLNRKRKSEIIKSLSQVSTFQELSESDKKYVLNLASRAFNGNITFEEFLRYGILAYSTEPNLLDPHWRPQYLLCNPCAINFDFIVQFENLREESQHILDYLQKFTPVEKKIDFPASGKPNVHESVAKKYFRSISPSVLEEVRKLYEKDFYYFGYDSQGYW